MRKALIFSIFSAGLLQGLALVAFPATSTIFTNAHDFGFSNSDYGALFIPQAVTSILASLASTRLNIRPQWFVGLIANIVSMALLAVSALYMKSAYVILLLATASLGIGFGCTVPAVNTLAALLFPNAADRAVLVMNVLLGLGTALAPVIVSLFSWWVLPLVLTLLFTMLLLFSSFLGLVQNGPKTTSEAISIPNRFWLFAIFALLYGLVETLNGNWLAIYMTHNLNTPATVATLALALFWALVTVGRLFFALIDPYFSQKKTYQLLPFVIAIAFLLIHNPPTALFGFALVGFGCSALLPLTISFAQEKLPSIKTHVSGGVVAFYLVGYGIAAFGVGPLGISLASIYLAATIPALALALLARPIAFQK